MKPISRRSFVGGSMTAGLALGMPRAMLGAGARAVGPNDAVNLAVVGLGSTTAVGGVGGRGHQLIERIREVPGARIVALCGDMQTMPGLGTSPAAFSIDIDADGNVVGLF